VIIPLVTAAGMVTLASGGVPMGMKDRPDHAPMRQAVQRPVMPLPQKNEDPRTMPYVMIEGGGEARLPMSVEEMDVYGYRTGQTIPLREAAKIIEERLQRQGR
jgi:hypothetical protein